MNPVDYAAMTDQELKQYFLAHRDDVTAFQAYLSRRRERSHEVIVSISDPDFDHKIQTAIRQQMTAYQNGERDTFSQDR